MITRKTGFVVGAALAAGLAIGFAGPALAANPTASPDHHSMMGGGGMMGGATFAPGYTFGPGMMGGLSQEERQQILERCDQMHDAMHVSASSSAGQTSR